MIRKQLVSVDLPEEPSNIRFENLGATTTKRFLRRGALFVVVVVVLSFALVSMYALTRVEGYQSPAPCKTVYSVEELQTNAALARDPETVFCFCSKQSAQAVVVMPAFGYCKQYLINRSYRQAVNFGLSILEFMVGVFIRSVIGRLARLMLFNKVSKEMTTVTYIIFVSDVVNFLIITILMKGDFYGFKPANVVARLLAKLYPPLVEHNELYSNFNTAWYLDIGSKMMSKFLLAIGLPYLVWFFYFPLLKCFNWSRAKSSKLQFDVYRLVRGRTFSMPNIGSKVMSQIFIALMWCAGIPVLVVFTFLFLLVCYLITKWAAVNHFKKPPQIDHNFVEYTAKFLPLCLVIHSVFSVILYDTSEVFNLPAKTLLSSDSQSKLGFLSKFDYRQHYFYYGLGAVSGALFIWDFVVVDTLKFFFIWDFLKNKVIKAKTEVEEEVDRAKVSSNPSFTATKKTIGNSAVISYDIKRSSEYRDVLLAMDFNEIEEDQETVAVARQSAIDRRKQQNDPLSKNITMPTTKPANAPLPRNAPNQKPAGNQVLPLPAGQSRLPTAGVLPQQPLQRGPTAPVRGSPGPGPGPQRGGLGPQRGGLQPQRGGLAPQRGGLQSQPPANPARGAQGPPGRQVSGPNQQARLPPAPGPRPGPAKGIPPPPGPRLPPK